jgi:hypothetical protein
MGVRYALVPALFVAYPDGMFATAIVGGKVIRFRLSAALARAHRENRGKTMSERKGHSNRGDEATSAGIATSQAVPWESFVTPVF